MNKNVVITVLVLVVLVIVGVLVYANREKINAPDSTPAETPSQNTEVAPEAGIVRQSEAPLAVTSSNAIPAETTVALTGTVNPHGALTNYWYEYGVTPNLGSRTPNQTIGFGRVALPAPAYITNLAKDTTYYFRLVAENSYSRSSGAQYAFHTLVGVPAPVGTSPTAKTEIATNVSRTAVTLNGEVIPNRAATQYWFEYGTTQNLGDTTSLRSVGDGTIPVDVSVTISGLAPSTTYYFRLNGQNQFGTVTSAILSVKTSGPPVAARPTVTTNSAISVGETTAGLRGVVNPNGAQASYWFEY